MVKNLTPPFAPATSISYKTDALPLPSDVYWIYSMFLCYYVAWPCDLDLWPRECFMYSASHVGPTYRFLLCYDYRLLSYKYWISDHISITWNSHCACHFQGATTKIKPCYRQKIAFSHYEDYRVYCACAVSRDLCTGGPPKPHVAIFCPQIVTMQLLWGYDDD